MHLLMHIAVSVFNSNLRLRWAYTK